MNGSRFGKTNGNVLGGGFKHFLFLSLSGEDEPNLTSIFFKWVATATNYSKY